MQPATRPPQVRRWLADAAQRIDRALGPTRVARIVLPPRTDKPGKEGEFCAVQLEDGSVGLSFVLLEDTLGTLHARRARRVPGPGTPALALAQGYATDDPAAKALGLAAINALACHAFDRAGFMPDAAADSFGSLAPVRGDCLGMVGHFSPLIEQARRIGIPVIVLELRADLVREEPGLVVTLDPQRLAACNKIVSTSTLLLNDTFECVSALWRNVQAVAIVGPSAGCPPDALFAAGVSSVGTTWVTDAEAFLGHLAAGEKWGATTCKVTLTLQRYPGLDALLDAALVCRSR